VENPEGNFTAWSSTRQTQSLLIRQGPGDLLTGAYASLGNQREGPCAIALFRPGHHELGFLAAVTTECALVEVDELPVGYRQSEPHCLAAGGADGTRRRSGDRIGLVSARHLEATEVGSIRPDRPICKSGIKLNPVSATSLFVLPRSSSQSRWRLIVPDGRPFALIRDAMQAASCKPSVLIWR
jgi:hypothetical protein